MATKADDKAKPEKTVNTGSTTKTEGVDRPSVEPTDPAPGKPKVNEDAPIEQKLADGGGAPVFMNSPLVRGIPVVVPVAEGVEVQGETVLGVALAAPVVPGAPEMIANAQAEYQVENQNWKAGDIKSIHEGQGEVQLDVVQSDGTTKTERHRADKMTYKKLEKSFEDGQKGARAFAKKAFGKDTRVLDPNNPEDVDEDDE
jgi:hypothetical protein